jgi:hypothetical protein
VVHELQSIPIIRLCELVYIRESGLYYKSSTDFSHNFMHPRTDEMRAHRVVEP